MPIRPAYIEIDIPSITISIRKQAITIVHVESSYNIILNPTYPYTWTIIVDNEKEIGVNFEESYVLSITDNHVKSYVNITNYEAKHLYKSLECNIKDIQNTSGLPSLGSCQI